ncbi:magnesium chelatase ATPase subunit I [Clostridium sporogenes]|uniref:ATP-binding protein n=1 Tax=Clostridium TaxID=1485 RepID=UPI00241F0FA6|nr:magnesium chelatase ATPase subunit I [Clostridium cochlearium]MBE6064238.1 magnesium chelatase ATPase subunit I [Clostridium cochlearium]
MKNIKKVYPFTAIVGQENMKKALILNVINPSLGGVLIRGEKGTAKSTAVRALAQLLPERSQVEGCIFGCDPEDKSSMCTKCSEKIKKGNKLDKINEKMKVVDLPVSATEDRVVGTLDIEYAIKKGEKKFEPGILAEANRNILYVDEVNFSHPAKFILVGTMNPEEGDLRPQLLDRFGMVVDVIGERDTKKRVEVIKRRLEYEDNNEEFILSYEKEQQKLRDRISKAKEILKEVSFDDKVLEIAAKISIEMEVDGHRADISMIKTAMTIAAFNGRDKVNSEDMLEAAELTLPHRMRRKPFEEGVMDFSKVEEIINEM